MSEKGTCVVLKCKIYVDCMSFRLSMSVLATWCLCLTVVDRWNNQRRAHILSATVACYKAETNHDRKNYTGHTIFIHNGSSTAYCSTA